MSAAPASTEKTAPEFASSLQRAIVKGLKEQAAELFKEIYLLETIIIEDVLEHNGYIYDDNAGEYPVWYKKIYRRNF